MTHKILGEDDFYSIYDMEDPEVIKTIEESDTMDQPHPIGYTIYKDFFVHPDGPKVSNDYWHGGSYHLARGTDWNNDDVWVAVETSLTDEATIVCKFVYTDWDNLKTCKLTEDAFLSLNNNNLKMDYRKCIAKNFVARVSEDDPNVEYTPLFFLRTEFEEFVEYTGMDMNYERRRVITHQKTYILTRMTDVPWHVPITEDKLINFNLTGLNSLYEQLIRYDRTYDEWFGFCFSPYNVTPLKLKNGEWQYVSQVLDHLPFLVYRPFLKIVLDSTTTYNPEAVQENIEQEFGRETITVENITERIEACYNLIPFNVGDNGCRRDLLRMIQKDGDHCCCDDCIRDDLKRLIVKLDCVFCGLQTIRDLLNSNNPGEQALKQLKVESPVVYSQIFGLEPNEPYTKWRAEIYVYETDQFYPNTTGKKNAELRRTLWMDVHAQVAELVEATTFAIPYNLYYANKVWYFGNPNVIDELTITKDRDEIHDVTVTDVGNYYTFVYPIEEEPGYRGYTMVKEISVNGNKTTEARFLFWLKQHYPDNCVFNLGTLMNIANQNGTYYNHHVTFLRDDFNRFLPDLRELLGNDIDVIPRIYSELCNQVIDLTPEVLDSFYMTFSTNRIDANLQHIFVDTFNVRRMDSDNGIFKVQLTSKKTNNVQFVVGCCLTKPTSSQMPNGFFTFETFEDTISLLNDYVYVGQQRYHKVVALSLTNGYYPLVEVPLVKFAIWNSSIPPFPEVLTRESYLQWFRLVSYIQNTLYTSVHSVATDCMRDLDIFYPSSGDDYAMQIYGVECYDATAVRNTITNLNNLINNEEAILNILETNANNLVRIFGTECKEATGNRLEENGTVGDQIGRKLDIIKESIPDIYIINTDNSEIFYNRIGSTLINDNSSYRKDCWDSVSRAIYNYFTNVKVDVDYIADIRLYTFRPESFNWISDVTMNDNTKGILLSKNELTTDYYITAINEEWKLAEN